MKPSTRIGSDTRALRRGFACASLLIATSVAGGAHGDATSDSERANLLFKKGKLAFNAGKFSDALRIYTEAWGLKKSPDIAANLAQAESELGKHRDAAEHFAYALAHILPSSTDEQRFALADGLDAEKKEIGTLRVTLEPADSVLTIDEVPITLPMAGDVYVEPGEHHGSVTHEGYEPHQETLNVSKGGARVLWIKLDQINALASPAVTPAPAAPADSAPPPLNEGSSRSIAPVIVGGGLVVAGAAVGVAFLLSGNSSQKDADALYDKNPEPNACGAGTPHAADCAALHGKNSDIDGARTVEVIGFSVAGAAAVGTAVYLLWPHSDTSTANHWAPTFAVAPGAGSIGLSGCF
jgi:tetratricopeptide (TPR) repeat protein